MTTRRQKRFLRRKKARTQKASAFLKKYDNFDIVCNRNNLFLSADIAKKTVMWKGSVQRWSIHQLLETERLFRDLSAGRDVRKGFSCFKIFERGKERNISAVKFYERVAQKCLCKFVLSPVYTRSLLYDNSASQEGKGVKFATDRMTKHLSCFYRKNKTNGYVLLSDFKGYFENIDHAVLKGIYRSYFKDERLLKLIDVFVDSYGERGLGLGSETSQMHAIVFPNKVDHFITETAREKIFYGRYMDDSYVIAKSKEELKRILQETRKIYDLLKINLSKKKTKIVKLKNPIRWLKTNFKFTDTGMILKTPTREGVSRERRKLKRQIRLVKTGNMRINELNQSFESWAGSMKRRNARLTVYKMRQLKRKETL